MATETRPAATQALSIPSRFCGPPGSGNGGYVCGSLAACADTPAVVTLRRPTPLDTLLTVESHADGSVLLRDGDTLIAEAKSARDAPPLHLAEPVSPAQARAAAARAQYIEDPIFPGCFVCGPDRQPGDGLRIFPGKVAGRDMWAAPWRPEFSVAGKDGRVPAEIVWAVLDCPSGIAAAEAAGLDTAFLLGQMTARVADRPEAGQQCTVIAWPGERDGRKLTAFSALLGPGGDVLAASRALWLTVPRLPAGGTS
jgi:hypothetical protein